ncbi:hypothetical protein TFKS16_1267 [Tannerella forsythia KS16]|uniref:hypothetical protein n=1 Tax=Tannerella forsythia TaxID=28112 RepID=UPI000618CF96|nr:hypothetical protein [Tannerella forsythia]BAR51534.1 hypothetical protein TFKS16_1267 [Tannerella forsythia KS16]
MRLNSFFFMLLLCFFFPRCEEEEAFELPEFSTSGKNTFGCYVDKELFVYTRGSGVLGHSPISGYYSEGGKYMDFYSYANKDRFIGITNSIVKVGFKHKVSDALYKDNNGYFDLCKDLPSEYCLLKFDKENGIISGTFSFSVKHIETGEIKTITDGRFDIKINIHD